MSTFYSTSSSSSSSSSSSTFAEKDRLVTAARGIHRVLYQPEDEWDFYHESQGGSTDLSLVLPHYRARGQPYDHRMNLFIGASPVAHHTKIKICRPSPSPRTHFHLEIQCPPSSSSSSSAATVTIWLPSDFTGSIQSSNHHKPPSFSPGFINRILPHISLNPYPSSSSSSPHTDSVIIHGTGTTTRVVFKMWDTTRCAPENEGKEALKRLFSVCTTTSSGATRGGRQSIDWDFLLED